MFEIFQKKLHVQWNDYYPQADEPTSKTQLFSYQTFNSRNSTLIPPEGNTYVYNCYFHEMKSDLGGAILSERPGNKNLLIEKCTFFQCKANYDSGAIRSRKGNVTIAFTCGQYNTAQRNDAFCAINSDVNRIINSVYYSSISYSEAKSQYVMLHTNSFIIFKSVNLSHNTATNSSALNCFPNKVNDNSLGTEISYCSFSNNTAKKEYCIFLTNAYNNECKHELKNSNIIKNKADCAIFSGGETNLIHSCILSNNSPLFCTADKNSHIFISFCTCDSQKSTGYGSVIEVTKCHPFVLGLVFLSTGSCVNSFELENINICPLESNKLLFSIHQIIEHMPKIFMTFLLTSINK